MEVAQETRRLKYGWVTEKLPLRRAYELLGVLCDEFGGDFDIERFTIRLSPSHVGLNAHAAIKVIALEETYDSLVDRIGYVLTQYIAENP